MKKCENCINNIYNDGEHEPCLSCDNCSKFKEKNVDAILKLFGYNTFDGIDCGELCNGGKSIATKIQFDKDRRKIYISNGDYSITELDAIKQKAEELFKDGR